MLYYNCGRESSKRIKGGKIMSLIRWEPFREMMSLRQAMDRLFEDSFIRPSRLWPQLRAGELPVDIYQTKDDVVVKAALAGVKPLSQTTA